MATNVVRVLDAIMFVVASLLFSVMVLVSYMNPGITNLDGSIGIVDNESIWMTLDPISSIVYTFGDYGCHQQMERSFIINGSQMPLCIREVSILVGIITGLLIVILSRINVNRKILVFSIVLASLSLVEWIIKAVFGVNIMPICIIVSIMSGFGIALFIHSFFHYEILYLNKSAI